MNIIIELHCRVDVLTDALSTHLQLVFPFCLKKGQWHSLLTLYQKIITNQIFNFVQILQNFEELVIR